jgi:peptidoglycan/LPS O-acetylase OafA/YrhL
MALNTLRAAAAIIVCLGHVRGYILVPRAEITGAFNEGMYALTSLGHGAVMVFFVLSGYFVGGSVIRGRRRDTFRWADYLISRSFRLWVVLIPALLLTLIADRIGIASFPQSAQYDSSSAAMTHSSPFIWFGNLLFQQTQLPTYGSNGALWSLGYEFSYYLIFPLVLIGVAGKTSSIRMRVLATGLLLVVVLLAGPIALTLFCAWLLGAGIAWQREHLLNWLNRSGPKLHGVMCVVSIILVVASMALDKYQGGSPTFAPPGTFLTMISSGLLIALLTRDAHPKSRMGGRVFGFVSGLAESSYSLYAYHLPVLVLIAVAITPRGPTSATAPNALGWLLVVTVTVALIGGGWLFARGTEHYYSRIRDASLAKLERIFGNYGAPSDKRNGPL